MTESPRFTEIKREAGRTIRVHQPREDHFPQRGNTNEDVVEETPAAENFKAKDLAEVCFVPDGDKKKPILTRLAQFPRQKTNHLTCIDTAAEPIFKDDIFDTTLKITEQQVELLFQRIETQKQKTHIVFETTKYGVVPQQSKTPVAV